MDIGFYIADLLREEDEVSVPGLGTFMKVRIAGSFDQVSNTFRPPSYQVSFKNTSSDNSLLTKYISVQKNLSASSSEYFIEKFSSNFSDLLTASGFAEIKPLGTIHKKNETLHFEASDSLEIASNFYGLKPLIDRTSKAVDTISYGVVKEGETVLSQDEEAEEIEETSKRSSLKLVFAILIPLILIGAILSYYLNPGFYNVVQKLRSDIFPVTEQPSPAPVSDLTGTLPDSMLNTADTLSENSDSLALKTEISPDTLNEQPAQVAVADNDISFEIIGAAFARKNDAEMYVKQLTAKGIEAKIVENMPGKMIKISLGSFKDEPSARIELSRIHKDLNKEAWIARIKPKKNP